MSDDRNWVIDDVDLTYKNMSWENVFNTFVEQWIKKKKKKVFGISIMPSWEQHVIVQKEYISYFVILL